MSVRNIFGKLALGAGFLGLAAILYSVWGGSDIDHLNVLLTRSGIVLAFTGLVFAAISYQRFAIAVFIAFNFLLVALSIFILFAFFSFFWSDS